MLFGERNRLGWMAPSNNITDVATVRTLGGAGVAAIVIGFVAGLFFGWLAILIWPIPDHSVKIGIAATVGAVLAGSFSYRWLNRRDRERTSAVHSALAAEREAEVQRQIAEMKRAQEATRT